MNVVGAESETLEDDEEIVGIYGRKCEDHNLVEIGLVVKVLEKQQKT